MIKKILAAFFILSGIALAQTSTLTGHLIDPSNTATTSKTLVHFELISTGGNTCRIAATGIVAPTVKDVLPNGSGMVTLSLIRNDQLTCGSTLGGSRWKYTIIRNGISMPSCVLNVASASVNLDSTACLNATPTAVATAPTDSVYARLDGTNAGFTGPVTFGSSLTVTGASSLASVNGDCVVDGVTHPFSSAGINACLAAVASEATVILAPGIYNINAQIGPITKSVNLIGRGWGSNLQVSGLSAATDVILVQPSSGSITVRFQDFRIAPASGTPARHAIHLDSTSGMITSSIFDHLDLEGLNTTGGAIFADGSGVGNGSPIQSTIRNCIIVNGINFPNSGDTNRILDNSISNSTGNASKAIEASFVSGASTFTVKGNNITSDGGIHLGTGVDFAIFEGNEIETLATFTGSNGSLIDVAGTGGSHAANVTIKNNSFQVVNGITANGVRVDFADRTQIVGNRFGRGATTSKDILITANATATNIGTNVWNSGGPITSMISDSGTSTSYNFQFVGQSVLNSGTAAAPSLSFSADLTSGIYLIGASITALTVAGNSQLMWSSNLQRNGSNLILGWSSTAAPISGASDVNITRQAAGVLQVGTGETANANGKFAGADWIGPVGATTPAAGSFTTLTTTGAVSKVNNVTTVGPGVCALVAKVDRTAVNADIAGTLLYAVPAAGGGMYRVSGYTVITTAAGVSSTLPNLQVVWTDADNSVAQPAVNITASSNGNSTGTNGLTGVGSAGAGAAITINAKASTNINYQTTGYASNAANAMQFAAHIKVEFCGN